MFSLPPKCRLLGEFIFLNCFYKPQHRPTVSTEAQVAMVYSVFLIVFILVICFSLLAYAYKGFLVGTSGGGCFLNVANTKSYFK